MGKFLAFPLILAISLIILACARPVKKAAAAGPGAEAVTPPVAGGPALSPPQAVAPPSSTGARPPAPSAKQKTGAIVVRPKAEGGVTALVAQGLEKRTLPEDFLIGALAGTSGAKSDSTEAARAAEAFLASVVAGTPNKKLLATETAQGIADMIAFATEKGYVPKSYRLGSPKRHENGEVTASVRLLGPDASSEGEIYVSRSGTVWLVSDLQINLAQLAEKKDKPKERFFPSAYRWLLEE